MWFRRESIAQHLSPQRNKKPHEITLCERASLFCMEIICNIVRAKVVPRALPLSFAACHVGLSPFRGSQLEW
jgi:hypothetical protein